VARIDRLLRTWAVNQVHSVVVPVSPDRAIDAVLAAPCAPGLVRALFWLRGVRAAGSVDDLLRSIGLEVLAREPSEVIFGGSGMPWRLRGGLQPFDDVRPGGVQMVVSFIARPLPERGGSRLTTVTRVHCVDEAAWRAFRRYWRLVGPWSGLIRRRWLAGVRRSLTA
jgi:hypothetical protein